MYLDGRYFSQVMTKEYDSVLQHPIIVAFVETDGETKDSKVSLKYSEMRPGVTTIGLVIVRTQHSRYQACVFLQGGEVWIWEPLQDERVISILKDYFEKYGLEVQTVSHEPCPRGMCNAYTLAYAYSWSKKRDFYPQDVEEIVRSVKKKYILKDGRDVEVFSNEMIGIGGISSKSDGNALIGGLGGALLGGAVAGPTGLVLGGLGGALIGSSVSHHSRNESRYL